MTPSLTFLAPGDSVTCGYLVNAGRALRPKRVVRAADIELIDRWGFILQRVAVTARGDTFVAALDPHAMQRAHIVRFLDRSGHPLGEMPTQSHKH